jgi:hypothetical protein
MTASRSSGLNAKARPLWNCLVGREGCGCKNGRWRQYAAPVAPCARHAVSAPGLRQLLCLLVQSRPLRVRSSIWLVAQRAPLTRRRRIASRTPANIGTPLANLQSYVWRRVIIVSDVERADDDLEADAGPLRQGFVATSLQQRVRARRLSGALTSSRQCDAVSV